MVRHLVLALQTPEGPHLRVLLGGCGRGSVTSGGRPQGPMLQLPAHRARHKSLCASSFPSSGPS